MVSMKRLTFSILFWHLLLGTVCTLAAPINWYSCLFVFFLSYLGTMTLILYWQLRLPAKPRLDDRSFPPAMQIARETLPLLRRGLNEETAQKVGEIIQKISDIPAVAITDQEKVLAFLGAGCEHHPVGMPILTQATRDVIATKELRIVRNKSEFHCRMKDCHCPLESAVIVPLICGEHVAGTLKLYQTQEGPVPDYLIKLAQGVAQLLSIQIELAELDHQAQLVTEAQLDALQAQINPHFLFNILNTIVMLIRTKPGMARRLISRLASFLRHSLKRGNRFISLEEELKFVRNYLILEKARFRDKLRIVRKIDKSLLAYPIPILSLQPLVENAIRHGITPKEGRGTIHISAQLLDEKVMEITVCDNGVGISPEILPRILEPGFGSGSGVGLSNVNERLIRLYGEAYALQIGSEPGVGTCVQLIIPIHPKKE
ncbi:sensor histidine kinase [Candidatus Formimonas warabiya]|uniref:histidine kinase n=1 Tax=Formimonas warabiya TaxID=1761012 RepID=A0A3G1L1Y6_FORW1|nr:sensor histidine kinase [Candidatus Formimonas warabiya]